MHDSIQFASTINSKYVKGACNFLRSLIKFNPDIKFKYNFLQFEELNNSDIESIKKIYPYSSFQRVVSEDYNYYNTESRFRTWEYNCFNRFDIFTIKAKKIIFFDLDMIVNKPLNYVFDTNFDFASVMVEEKNRIDHPSKKIFDGGLMVISEKFLSQKTKDELIKISKIKKWSSDEPVLNQYFENKIQFLPKEYNVLSYEYSKYKNNFAILQYVGSKKPWFGDKIEECYDEYIIKNNKINDLIKMKTIFNNYDN